MNATQCIVSIGELCDRYQAPLPQVERALKRVRPVISIDGIPFFDEADAERLVQSMYDPSPSKRHKRHAR